MYWHDWSSAVCSSDLYRSCIAAQPIHGTGIVIPELAPAEGRGDGSILEACIVERAPHCARGLGVLHELCDVGEGSGTLFLHRDADIDAIEVAVQDARAGHSRGERRQRVARQREGIC